MIRGNTVGFPNPKANWTQEDPTLGSHIENKPTGADVEAIGTERRVLTANDAGKFLRVDVASLIVVPSGLPIGMELEMFRNTTETVILQPSEISFAVQGSVELTDGEIQIIDAYASVVLKHIADDVWSVQGAV